MSHLKANKHYVFQGDTTNLRPIAELFHLAEGIVFADIGWCEPSGCSFNPFVRVHIEDMHKIIEVLPGSPEEEILNEWQDKKVLLGEIASSERCLAEVKKQYPDAQALA